MERGRRRFLSAAHRRLSASAATVPPKRKWPRSLPPSWKTWLRMCSTAKWLCPNRRRIRVSAASSSCVFPPNCTDARHCRRSLAAKASTSSSPRLSPPPSSVSDFVLHAAKQNGCAILKGSSGAGIFRIFRLPPIRSFVLWIERCFCPPPLLPRVTSGLFEHRSEVMETLEVVGRWSAGTQSRKSGGSSNGVSRSIFTKRLAINYLNNIQCQPHECFRKCHRHFHFSSLSGTARCGTRQISIRNAIPASKSDRLLAESNTNLGVIRFFVHLLTAR